MVHLAYMTCAVVVFVLLVRTLDFYSGHLAPHWSKTVMEIDGKVSAVVEPGLSPGWDPSYSVDRGGLAITTEIGEVWVAFHKEVPVGNPIRLSFAHTVAPWPIRLVDGRARYRLVRFSIL